MAMMPRRVKYRKMQRRKAGNMKGIATRCNKVNFGDFGLKSTETGYLTAKQIEACRITATRFLQPLGKFYIRVFPWKPYTKKPAQVDMGGGKGDVQYYTTVVKPGTILFEIGGVEKEVAKECFNLLAHKLPVKTIMVERIDY
jgi:large subunit ribosomal protein L16